MDTLLGKFALAYQSAGVHRGRSCQLSNTSTEMCTFTCDALKQLDTIIFAVCGEGEGGGGVSFQEGSILY